MHSSTDWHAPAYLEGRWPERSTEHTYRSCRRSCIALTSAGRPRLKIFWDVETVDNFTQRFGQLLKKVPNKNSIKTQEAHKNTSYFWKVPAVPQVLYASYLILSWIKLFFFLLQNATNFEQSCPFKFDFNPNLIFNPRRIFLLKKRLVKNE